MTTGRSDAGAARLLDAIAIGMFAAHAALRLSLKGGDTAWGSNLTAHLLLPLAAAVWLAARALERRFPWRWTGFELPLAAIAALALITSFGASYRLGALDGAAGWCAAILAVPLAVHLFGPEARSQLRGLLVAVIAVAVLYGVVQYVQLGELQTYAGNAELLERSPDSSELAGRIGAREPMSTLHYPNTFAGLLVLSLPFVLGAALDSRSRAVKAAGFAVVAAGAFGLWASGSMGGGVAAAAAGLAFGILLAVRRWPAWRARILAGCGVAIVAVAVLVAAGPLSPDALARRSEAIAIRDVYWDAAIRIAKAHPFGVGLNNFEDHYYAFKDERQEEVRTAHNDYLQILAEQGVAGLLAFLLLIGAVFAKGLGPAAADPAAPSEGFRTPIGVGLAIGWLAAFGFQGAFGSFVTTMFLGAAGIGTFLLFSKGGAFGDLARLGLVAGLAGSVVHFLVDFDLADPGFRHLFFLSLGALALMSRIEAPSIAGSAVAAAAAGVLFVIALPLASIVAPRFLEADEHGLRASMAAAPEEADPHWEAAAAANALNPTPAVELGLSQYFQWARSPEDMGRSELAITILEDAIERRPRHASIEARLAEVQEAVARRMETAGTGIEAASASALRREAVRHARRAVELYPTSARHRYLLGRILDGAGQAGEAAAEFREALRLSALARRVPRLRLDGVQAAVATLKTGGSRERALQLFRDWPRPRSFEARLPLLTPDEKSIVDAAADSK